MVDRFGWRTLYVVGAIIVPQPGVTLEPESIRGAAAAVLASYKVPRVVLVCAASELPVLPSSKVDRRRVAAMLAEAAITRRA